MTFLCKHIWKIIRDLLKFEFDGIERFVKCAVDCFKKNKIISVKFHAVVGAKLKLFCEIGV